ncbi:hypothetical protein [Bifidobacterium cuniculi]|uniref:Uncharacterized protein n=1 Tax=Bifidobacterium cuniculi TaxID=1688 RepID=A0A087AQG3_9BIFI|nr:hypothetical protein [Bifidobacterium cuniculi]KFI61013.1 hypothetical protein BCUN_0990 [Bifidobacterium cuniculi]
MMEEHITNTDPAARIVAMAMDAGKGGEAYLFDLRQNGEEFTLGLSTVLACLRFAELAGAVPRVSAAWWERAASIVCDGGVFRKRLRSERPVGTDPGTLPEAQLREPGIFDHDSDPMHDCMEQYEFHMSRRAHGFDMGLSLVLTCLSFAGAQGALPQLAPNWWVDVCCRYPAETVGC